MEHLDWMQRRHSVRQYRNTPIESEKRAALDALAAQINREHGLHIQICYDEPHCFDSFLARYGKFSGVQNYIALIGKKAPGLEETLGYYGEALVEKAQELGLNTCWVALTKGKSQAALSSGEKQVCLIALGYGVTQGTPHQSKPLASVCNQPEAAPDWFRQGMEAALLAPTAMNQQKFFFTLSPNGTVKATCGSGFYTKLDLGIVRYHFERAAGKPVQS